MNRYSSIRKKPNKKIVISGIIFLLVIGGFIILRPKNKTTSAVLGTNDISVAPARYTAQIDREFKFPIYDANGEEVSKIKYYIEKADLKNEIIVQGKKATAIKGRTFLVLTIKLTNDLDNDIEINTRDYVRLQINGSNDHLAADIHSDPVKVAAIATKPTRIGFPIDDNLTQDLVLRVGEIKGDKEEIPISFK